jgi:MFS family permease
MQWVLRVSSVFCAVATGVFLLLASQRPRTKTFEIPAMSNHTPHRTGLWRKLLLWSAFYTVTTFFVTIGRTFVQTFLTEQVLLSEFYIGVFGSLNFAGITFIGLTMGRLGDRWQKSKALGICALLYASSMIPIMLVREPVFLMSAAFFYGGAVVIGSLVGSYVGGIAPVQRRGVWVSIPQTFSLLAAFAAPYIGGYLYTQWPYNAFIVSILPMPFLALFAFCALKE